MAYQLDAGLVPVRKLGKLPAETITVEYALEYGSNTLEIHRDAIQPGQKVLIVDDLLATGGTVKGTIELVERLKGEVVGLAFLVELEFLKGRDRLDGTARHQRHPVLTDRPHRGPRLTDPSGDPRPSQPPDAAGSSASAADPTSRCLGDAEPAPADGADAGRRPPPRRRSTSAGAGSSASSPAS